MNGDGQMSDQEVGEELGRRMRAAARSVDGAGLSIEQVPATAPTPEAARLIQETVWEVVTSTPGTGVLK